MDCRRFRANHTVFVDLACSALEENEMRDHLQNCPGCARHDMIVRRSLMLVRNLPTIEPSPDFLARLEARLRIVRAEGLDMRRTPRASGMRVASLSFGMFAALAAGMAFAAYIAADSLRAPRQIEMRFAPVVAVQPEAVPSPVATSALVATVPTGMSVWPAIMVASQAPMHFVAAEMASER